MVFFSSEDMSELEERVADHNFYLSLIVNIFGDKCAKIAHIEKTVYNNVNGNKMIKNNDGKWISIEQKKKNIEEEVMVLTDCDIEIDGYKFVALDWLAEKIGSLLKAKEVKNTPKYPNFPKQLTVPFYDDDNFYNHQSYDKDQVVNFLKHIIALDVTSDNEKQLVSMLLSDMEDELETVSTSKGDSTKYSFNYISSVNELFDAIYSTFFGTMDDDAIVADVIDQCTKELGYYSSSFPNSTSLISTALKEVNKTLRIHGGLSPDFSQKP